MSATKSERRGAGWGSIPGFLLFSGLSLAARLCPAALAYRLAFAPAAAVFLITLWRERRLNRRGRGALRNMRIAFGERSPRELRRLAWRYSLHVTWTALEILRLPRLDPRRVERTVDRSELGPVLERLAQGRGVIAATGHLGNWEVFGVGAATFVESLTTLVRPIPEPGLDRWLNGARAATGQRVRAKVGGLWTLAQALREGGGVGLNVDENMRKGGVFVPFCGVLAATNPSAFGLMRRTGASIAVATCHRVGRERFRVRLWDLIDPGDVDLEADGAEAAVIGRVARGFERALTEHPEQWLWSLRRWATRPPDEQPNGELPPRVGPPLQLEIG